MLEQLIDLDTRLTLALNGSTSLYLDGLAVTLTATLTWLPAALVLLYVLVKNNDTVNLLDLRQPYSPAFYALVERWMSDWRQRRAALKTLRGAECP